MEKALSKNPALVVFTFEGKSALHIAAASFVPDAVDSVRWLLEKGFPWCDTDRSGRLAEDWARIYKHESRITVLRNWAIEFGDHSFAVVKRLQAYRPHRIQVILPLKPRGG